MGWRVLLVAGAMLFSQATHAQSPIFITAFTEEIGNSIEEGTAQSDNTPFMVWMVDDPPTPIAGYSTELNGEPDCDIDTTESSIALGPLPDGLTEFYVRALDETANCGPAANFLIFVDATTDEILTLVAYTENGGILIEEGIAQPDNTPFMAWTVAVSTAPIVGYSTALNAEPDCDVDTVENSMDFGPLPDGTAVFYVRAVDEAGNCGLALSFEIVVFRPDDLFRDGFEDER